VPGWDSISNKIMIKLSSSIETITHLASILIDVHSDVYTSLFLIQVQILGTL